MFFDKQIDFDSLKASFNDKKLQLFEDNGLFPHLERIHYDECSETLAFFSNFYIIKIMPMLHNNYIKMKMDGKKHEHHQILATKLDEESNILFVFS